VEVVAQGLSGSPWYQASKARYSPRLRLRRLNSGDAAEWAAFRAENGGALFATLDSELPDGVPASVRGVLNEVYPGPGRPRDPWPYYSHARLGRPYRDFFDKDLGVSYAQGMVGGAAALGTGGLGPAELRRLRLASVFDPDAPDAPLYEGFYHSARGEWAEARDCFLASAGVYDRLLRLSDEYRSLPSLNAGLASASAYARLNYGVALEKTGDKAGAEAAYLAALAANPRLADAHYNLAILYWNRDWDRVRRELQETLRLNPAHPAAGRYLAQLAGR